MKKASAIAHSNIAFTKYWGKKDEKLNIPTNNSISMNLSDCYTITTVEFSEDLEDDDIEIIDTKLKPREKQRIIKHLSQMRELVNVDIKAKVRSKNSFPKAAGIASSASGHAALAMAGSHAAGLKLNEHELSALARLGSGSASRSIPSGFVEWIAGTHHRDSYAVQIAPPEHFDIRDIIAIVAKTEKKVGSTEGHRLTCTSDLYNARLSCMEEYNNKVRKAIKEKDFKTLGEYSEKDALCLHAIMMTSSPSLRYLIGDSLKLMDNIEYWREDGIQVYYTIDAGHNIHILTLPEYKDEIIDKLKELNYIKEYISNKPADGAKLIDDHLF